MSLVYKIIKSKYEIFRTYEVNLLFSDLGDCLLVQGSFTCAILRALNWHIFRQNP